MAAPKDISCVLKDKGIVVIEDYFTDDEVDEIGKYFDVTHNDDAVNDNWYYYENDVQKTILSVEDIDLDVLNNNNDFYNSDVGIDKESIVSKFLNESFIRNICKKYYQNNKYIFPIRIQFVKTKTMSEAPNIIPFSAHADRQRFLKFYININDVDVRNGPLHADLNTRKITLLWIQFFRGIQLSLGVPWQKLRTKIKSSPSELTPIATKRNSLVIFNSNMPHFAGKNVSNNTRKVIIIEAQTIRGYKKYGKPTWLKSQQ